MHKNCAFIVGCGHSGTSLLLRLLGEHPKIYAIPDETKLFTAKDSKKRIDHRLSNFDQKAERYDKKIWIEKTPKHVRHISEIHKFRPEAKIIGISRDPRDTACSIKARGLSFEQGIQRWIYDNALMMEHFGKSHFIFVKLEDLITNTEKELEKIFNFLSVQKSTNLEYHKKPAKWYSDNMEKPPNASGDNHRQYRNWQINQPIFASTKRYHTDMSRKDNRVFSKNLSKIKPLAENLGYSDINQKENLLKTVLKYPLKLAGDNERQ